MKKEGDMVGEGALKAAGDQGRHQAISKTQQVIVPLKAPAQQTLPSVAR